MIIRLKTLFNDNTIRITLSSYAAVVKIVVAETLHANKSVRSD